MAFWKSGLIVYEPHFWYLLAITWLLTAIWSRRRLYWISWKIPGPISLPLIGNVLLVLKCGVTNVIPAAKKLVEEYGSTNRLSRVWVGPELFLLVADASVAAQVNSLTLNKADLYQSLLPPFLEKGLFVDKNISHWKSSRKQIVQIFHFNLLKKYVPIFHEESLILVSKLQKYTNNGQSLYPPNILVLATYGSILRTMVGVNFNVQRNEDQPFVNAVHSVFEHLQAKIFYPFLRNRFIYSLLGYRKDEVMHGLKMFKEVQIMLDNQDITSNRPTLTQLLMQMQGISMDEVKAQISTLLGAGLDTSMAQISVLLLLLALHPDVQTKVYEEVVQTLGDDPSICPSDEDLKKLVYLDRVLKECLRMLPAAPVIARKTTEDISLTCADGIQHTIPPGVTVAILIHAIQNSAHYYERPEMFDPDRWLPENMTKRDPQSFLPFSSGPRNCPGGKYAVLLMKIFTVAILRTFEILPTDRCRSMEDFRVKMNITLSIDTNCEIKLRARETADVTVGQNCPAQKIDFGNRNN